MVRVVPAAPKAELAPTMETELALTTPMTKAAPSTPAALPANVTTNVTADGPVIVTGISLLYQRQAFYRDRHEQRRYPFPFHGMSPLFQRYTLVQVQSHISSDHLLILSIFLSSISSFSQIDMGWESV